MFSYCSVYENTVRNPILSLKRAKHLRRPMTPQELGLWLRVKNRQLGGFKFRRQHPVGPYILDFYCPEARLAVEIDGQSHWSPEQEAHDARRDAWFQEMGIETLRLSAESLKRPGAAADRILEVVRDRALSTTRSSAGGPPLPRAGEVA
jgi:very-short-patch-repair endonuclease